MKKNIKTGIAISAGSLMPLFALARGAGAGSYNTIGGALKAITNDILQPLITLIIAIGLVVFLWGIVKYVTAGGDESKAKEGRDLMIYGIIALFVMVSVWGLVNILHETFQLSDDAPDIPHLGN